MPIRVAFVLFYVESWDSLAQTHRLMLTDPRFEVLVAVVAKRLTGDAGFDDGSAASAYLADLGVDHVNWAFDDADEAGRRLREWAPDYAFMNYPWQRNYQPSLRPDALVEFTRIAYVPYFSLSLVQEPDGAGGFVDGVAPHYFTQRLHQLASLVFVQSTEVKAAFAGTQRGDHGVVVVGSPKLDELVAAVQRGAAQNVENSPIAEANGDARPNDYAPSSKFDDFSSQIGQIGGKYGDISAPPSMVFAPHHSYSPHWLNFGTFAATKDLMLEVAQRNPDTQFALRAHPFMWGTLVDREVLTPADVASWRATWDSLPNTEDASAWPLARVFGCDVLVSDGISFLAEYPLATGKTGIFLERPDHWPFTALGELAAEANCRLRTPVNIAIFEAKLAEIRQENIENSTRCRTTSHPIDPPTAKGRKIDDLRRAAMPYAGQAANRIVETVLSHWSMKPGLVDPREITEIPWELQAGREPQPND